MNKVGLAALVGVLSVAVVADYYGLLGVREARVSDYRHITFEFIDAKIRAPISDVHVACTRPGVRSSCTESRGPGIGQTTITLGAIRVEDRSWLFQHVRGFDLGENGIMFLKFFTPNHERTELVIHSTDAVLNSDDVQRIELNPVAATE